MALKHRKIILILGSFLLCLSTSTFGTERTPAKIPLGAETPGLGGHAKKPSTSQGYAYTRQPDGIPDQILNKGEAFLREFKTATREDRHRQTLARIGEKPLEKWEVVEAWSNLEKKSGKINNQQIAHLKRDLSLEPYTKLSDFRNNDNMAFNANSVSGKRLVREANYKTDKGKLTFEMMIDYDRVKEEVRGVYVAANVHSSDYSNPVTPARGKPYYPASLPDIQKSEEVTLLSILDKYPEFKGATVTVVRDPELMKPGFKDPRGIKAKEFHGEMRFIRHIRDADLLSKIGHSDAMGIIADKNYCAGGERSCKKVLDRDEFKRLAVEDKLGLSTAKYENPHWKAPEEKPVVTSVIRDTRNGREGLDGASKGLPKLFQNLKVGSSRDGGSGKGGSSGRCL